MAESRFVYVTYIRTTPEKLWQALTAPEFTRQYWAETWQDCDWKQGASWKLMIPDGRVGDTGEVLEIDPPRRLVLSWQNQFEPELKAEGHSRATFELEPEGDMVKLTVDSRDGQARLEAHRGRLERLAADSREPQEPAGDRRVAGSDAEVAGGDVTPTRPAMPRSRIPRAPDKDRPYRGAAWLIAMTALTAC